VEFNEERFFEAHEVWEELWHEYREMDRTFIQGLIHLAAGYYHNQCANEKGTVSQLNKGMEKLNEYFPEHLGVPIEALLKRTEEIARAATGGIEATIQFPKIHVDEIQPNQP